MQATTKRHIHPTTSYDAVLPKATHSDTVIKGNAHLRDTLSLMHQMIHQTSGDTRKLAPMLKGNTVYQTCKNIWEFVYRHIQYKMDKAGIEQVRRPARSWADRFTGVDCDCYTVFIGTLLHNLRIPFEIRITKYGGKAHFQHVYPIVPTPNGHITIDCVADRFNYEVPYSQMKSFTTQKQIQTASGLSGVDTYDIQLEALEQPRLPLWHVHRTVPQHAVPCVIPQPKRRQRRHSRRHHNAHFQSPHHFQPVDHYSGGSRDDPKFSTAELLLHTAISLGLGYGVYRLFSKKKKTKK